MAGKKTVKVAGYIRNTPVGKKSTLSTAVDSYKRRPPKK